MILNANAKEDCCYLVDVAKLNITFEASRPIENSLSVGETNKVGDEHSNHRLDIITLRRHLAVSLQNCFSSSITTRHNKLEGLNSYFYQASIIIF